MKEYKIYTAGKMGNLSFVEQMDWRLEVEDAVKQLTDAKVRFFHPPLFYAPDGTSYEEEVEAKQFDLAKLRESDIMIVNLDGLDSSIGTVFEIATVEAINQSGGKHIYTVGIGDRDKQHPWIKSALLRCEKDIDHAANYIMNYLLEE